MNAGSLHGYEARIMALADAGLPADAIVAKTGLARSTVVETVARLQFTGRCEFQVMARQGSRSLIAAIRRHHPERCGPERCGVTR